MGGPRIASIGSATSATLCELGLSPTVEANEHTIPGLLRAIIQFEAGRGDHSMNNPR
jgi:uroporphyrinogen-III synthase